MRKKLLSALVSGFALAVLVPASSFAAGSQTDINGTVTKGGSPVKHAVVQVTCLSNTKQAQTDATGAYRVAFTAKKCPAGSTVSVSASKSGVGSGSNSGTVSPDNTDRLNVGIVDVNIVPEFGLITAGAATIIGGAAFMAVRRRQTSGHEA
jgi:hypothetical protein